MERLTERSDDKCKGCDEIYESRCMECSKSSILYDRLAEYEDAEEDGRLIVFPVAVGDHVWCFPSAGEPYREMQVIGLCHKFGINYVEVQDVVTCEGVYFDAKSLGSTMFLTEKEAKAKLAEWEKEWEKQNGTIDKT